MYGIIYWTNNQRRVATFATVAALMQFVAQHRITDWVSL